MKTEPQSFRDCFTFDAHPNNPIPRGKFRKIFAIFFSARYSMPVVMRISQYFYNKSNKTGYILSAVFRRFNQVMNNFDHGANPRVEAGCCFHHTGVCITSNTYIESGVHIYRNVTFGGRDKKAPYVKKNAKICSHSIVIGDVIIGEESIVAPGSVVINDVPSRKVVGGAPAMVIGDVTLDNYDF